jgi:hypothetical protein
MEAGMRHVHIIHNYCISRYFHSGRKGYKHIVAEVMEHDKVTQSSWYYLTDIAYAELLRFRRSKHYSPNHGEWIRRPE